MYMENSGRLLITAKRHIRGDAHLSVTLLVPARKRTGEMKIVNGSLIFLRRLESSLTLMLGKNELSSAASVRQSKYITKAIGYAQGVIDSDILADADRSIIEDLLNELNFAYENCTTFIGERKGYSCDFMSDSGYENELMVLKSRIQGRLLPEIQKMLSKRPLFVTEETRRNQKKPQGKDGQGEPPGDLIDLAKAVELYHRSRAQLKRDIEDDKIKDHRKIKKGKHWISKSEADNLYIPK